MIFCYKREMKMCIVTVSIKKVKMEQDGTSVTRCNRCISALFACDDVDNVNSVILQGIIYISSHASSSFENTQSNVYAQFSTYIPVCHVPISILSVLTSLSLST